MLYLLRDKKHTPRSNPLKAMKRQGMIWVFVGLQLFGFGATFAITQTIAAIGFPVIILLLVPVRTFLLPRWFREEELAALDEPTASPFTMESVGGNFGEELEEKTSGDTTPNKDKDALPNGSEQVERGEAHGLKRRESRNGHDSDAIEMWSSTSQSRES